MCKTNHYGHGNTCKEYSTDDTIQSRSTDEKDLGVMMSSILKHCSQHVATAKKAMSAIHISWCTFKYIDEESFKVLYKTARP